ncbi:unnamed protein product [Rotaria sp. Silwood1]|nr:unnamed protein product [Rotaria sp. Silwood1]CAF4783007.1 unnamed protein product [Rotaria sp. Silwood1]
MSNHDSLPIDFDKYIKLTNISHWIYPIWSIGFIILGTIGNIFSLIIFIRWINRLSIYIYFTVLCIVNILIINVDITYHYFLPFLIDNEILIKNLLPITCKFMFFLTYFLRYLFIWLIVMINIDRCLYVTENSLKLILCRQQSANIICIILISFSFFANFHFLIYFNDTIITETLPKNQCVLENFFYYHCQSSNRHYQYFIKTIWPIYNLIIFAIMPILIMFICFILIIRSVYLIRQNKFVYDKRHSRISSIIPQNDRDHLCSIAKILVCLDLLFPMTVFPILFAQIYINYNPPKTCLNIGIINLIFSIGFSISFIKNTFAFLIFYCTSRQFRRVFSALIRCKKTLAYSQTR